MKNAGLNLVILVVGIVLLVLGFNEYGAFGSRAGRMLGFGISNRVVLFFIAGAACTAYGLVKILNKK